jgi:heme exporter protein A
MIVSLAIEDLALRRGERTLFQGVSLRLSSGEALGLLGANGAGKTSLLRAVAGFIAPMSGHIAYGGLQGDLEAEEARRSGIHLVGHQDGLKNGRTAGEELAFQALWTGGTPASAAAAAETLGLTRLLQLEVRKLSAGQRRRLALARLLASPRSLWLLDEPLAPLDARHRALFGELMGEHLAGGGLILAAIHDPLPIAARTLELGA